MLRHDLPAIINYCNDNEIYYTVISNNTSAIQPLIKKLFDPVEHVVGFTSSVDPVFYEIGFKKDRISKSIEVLNRLNDIQDAVKVSDVVAYITVMKHNQHMLHRLVQELSAEEIYSDITFVDTAKSWFYDFSNVRDSLFLVQPTFELAEELVDIISDVHLLVHMKDILIPKMFNTLPSNFDCEIEKGLHNITIDADGTIRLCLRIRGISAPSLNVTELFDKGYPTLINDHVFKAIVGDKMHYCKLCNHSCLMMSQYFDKTNQEVDDLIHSDKREV